MTALATLRQSVILSPVRARDRCGNGVVPGRPVHTGLVRRADSATTGSGPVVCAGSTVSEDSQRPILARLHADRRFGVHDDVYLEVLQARTDCPAQCIGI